ncbi:hypothetical protein [Flavihumibacter solisilvae]|uniref:Viral A-type inclusion protein n=1 Tax=Flavihumibacter solisilvae TaxID=1349421 RepID=A0A0C1IQ33_9BACT|nr:hypothetical protein [Flavihumibacter solisilvae]KIC96335.1 hypothetical protein OI18_00835 [Flavihumibacter solisilvae]
MKNIYISALVLCVISTGCNNATDHSEHRKDGFSDNAKTPQDSLYQLVMDGHDVGMAKMGKIRSYQQQAQKALDSIQRLPASAAKERLQQTFMGVQEDLNFAEYSMNTWMEEFIPDSAKDNPEGRLTYLKTEHEKVEKVKNNIQLSLQRADSLFKK